MDWPAALAVAAALVALATGLGLLARRSSGRVRLASGTAPDASGRASAAELLGLGHDRLGSTATLVQFSTEYCSRCPATARQLGELADGYGGDGAVRHLDVDLTRDAATADRFAVTQTPTVLVLDAAGAEVARIGGPPRASELRDLLDTLTRSTHVS
ncbi:thioredoxin family protein [Agromyces larvae]|uniref:Thioredoxin family protein n=1 Tax=Agromyces larvae TaxID=2929802 RepID=A0ABY4BZZ6_9MICO|nr:thioredoxin family protein [Agromyces larvae]UOE44745.1 thioredoxin family protein [Agromyces larvae]